MNLEKYLKLLGHKVEDRVTGMQGVVSSIGFDLYGCIQAIVNPGVGKDGKPLDQLWFDVGRLKVISKNPVMEQPSFAGVPLIEGKKGPAERPSFTKA